jgi:hypothetical protein
VEEFLAALLRRAALVLLELLFVQLLRWLWDTIRSRPSLPQPA